MPRQIEAKYGVDPVQQVPPFSFTSTQIERLLEALAPVNGDRQEIIKQLENCARDYFWLRNGNRERPTRAEQNAALEEITEFAHDLGRRLRSLDMDTQWEVMMALPLFNTNNRTVWIEDCADRVEALAHAAKQALRTGKQETGPRVPTHLQRTVARLATLYEELTNKPFSHNPKQGTEYDGQPHSPAGRFITAFFGMVDPSIPATRISTAMASIVKSRSGGPKSATG
jgi:hypothetical protein